jgi:hypothetical protein
MRGFEIGCVLSKKLKDGERGALADFSLDSRILNKISTAAALRLLALRAKKQFFGLKYVNSLMRMRIRPGSGNLFDPGSRIRDGKNSDPG